MANEEHLKILLQGVEVWNEWRVQNKNIWPNLVGADLSGEDLSGADLSEVILNGADLTDSDLSQANLSSADLNGTIFTRAYLVGADFTNAVCAGTLFVDVDLSQVKGLDTVRHVLTSSIAVDTLYLSKGKIPQIFLRGCGIPENLIAALPLLFTGAKLETLPNSIFGIPIDHHKFQCDIFMIMPFAEEFQRIYDDHIKPIAEGLGHTIKRGDDFFGKTSIMTDIWSAINNAKLVIAECTGRNPNVFYEMGIAHTLDKPVIMITQNMDDVPFDIRHLRVIKYEYNPRGVQRFEWALKTAISNMLEE